MMKPNIEFTTDASRVDLRSLGYLYESVGFGIRDNYANPDVSMEKLFGPGVFGFFVFQDEHLIGMARVFSDDCLCSWIAELCVHPEWQAKGVGRKLLDLVNERFSRTAIYAEAFKGQETFFANSGIRTQSKLIACGRAPLKKETDDANTAAG